VSFVGPKDLVQFYLAADHSNHLVASCHQTRHPAGLAAAGYMMCTAEPGQLARSRP
jgi:phosphoenolpyruvate-protein kinase (PTS system EI component)